LSLTVKINIDLSKHNGMNTIERQEIHGTDLDNPKPNQTELDIHLQYLYLKLDVLKATTDKKKSYAND
jgi:hypothetical protein